MDGEGEGKRNVSRREAGRLTLEAVRPSPMDVLLTLNNAGLDGKSSVRQARFQAACLAWCYFWPLSVAHVRRSVSSCRFPARVPHVGASCGNE